MRGNRWDSENNDVWFYTHWSGRYTHLIVQRALARKQRWDDESYLARIVFDTLTEDAQGEETGLGISARRGDGTYPTMVVNVRDQRVELHKDVDAGGAPDASWPFVEYIDMILPEYIGDLV